MEKVSETKYPNVDVIRKAGGSTKMARMISEQKKIGNVDYTNRKKLHLRDHPDQRRPQSGSSSPIFGVSAFPGGRAEGSQKDGAAPFCTLQGAVGGYEDHSSNTPPVVG